MPWHVFPHALERSKHQKTAFVARVHHVTDGRCSVKGDLQKHLQLNTASLKTYSDVKGTIEQ
eukprot:7932624-Alexandrium_andersonii.AAC.1